MRKYKPITKCDECNTEDFQENMVNLYPQLNEEMDELKEEFNEYDGMVCSNCYAKMLYI